MVQDLDEVLRKLREGKLVPSGSPRAATIGTLGEDVEPGEVLPGPYLIVSAAPSGDDIWEAQIVRLVEPEPIGRD